MNKLVLGCNIVECTLNSFGYYTLYVSFVDVVMYVLYFNSYGASIDVTIVVIGKNPIFRPWYSV